MENGPTISIWINSFRNIDDDHDFVGMSHVFYTDGGICFLTVGGMLHFACSNVYAYKLLRISRSLFKV